MTSDFNLSYLVANPGSASIFLQSPAWLLLLVAAVVFFLIGRQDSTRQRLAARCRAAAFALVVLALAGLTLATSLPDDRLSLIAVVDVSQSIDDEGRRWQASYIDRATSALAPGDEIGVVEFGQTTLVTRPPGSPRSYEAGGDLVHPTGTDIGKALDTALALFPPDVERRVLLLSDGNETRGDALASIPRALRSRASIYAAIPPHAGGADTSIEKLIVPPVVAEGAVFSVRIVLRNRGRARQGLLSLHLDDELLGEERVTLDQGLNTLEIPYRMIGAGSRRLRAGILVPEDVVPANNEHEATLTVGSEPSVLVVSTRARPPIATVLEQKDIRVVIEPPSAMPDQADRLARYDAVILEDTDAGEIGGRRLDAIERYVREIGGGFVVAAGRMTYGDAGFKGTALERLLPVTLEPRRPPRVERQPLALFLLIDRSNSMGYHFRTRLQRSTTESKLVYAKRAALAVL
jgi:hypothetical protein